MRSLANILWDKLATVWEINLHCTSFLCCKLSLTWFHYSVELGNKPKAQIAVKKFCFVECFRIWMFNKSLQNYVKFPFSFSFYFPHVFFSFLFHLVLFPTLKFRPDHPALLLTGISRNQWLLDRGLLCLGDPTVHKETPSMPTTPPCRSPAACWE